MDGKNQRISRANSSLGPIAQMSLERGSAQKGLTTPSFRLDLFELNLPLSSGSLGSRMHQGGDTVLFYLLDRFFHPGHVLMGVPVRNALEKSVLSVSQEFPSSPFC